MGWHILLGVLVTIVVAFPLVAWFILAPRNLFFTFVKEGTAKIVVRGDKFEKVLIQWEEHTLNKDWNVVMGKEPWHPLGGFRFYGFWPIMDVFIYNFQWTGVKENGEIDPHPKETVDYILLKDDTYWAKVEKAEDAKLLPLDVEIVLTIRIVNPYKALFRVENWLETVVNRTKPAVRDAITLKEYEELIKDKEAVGKTIYERLNGQRLLREFSGRYGVDLRKIEVKEINPPEKYRDDTLKTYLAEKEADQILVLAGARKQEAIILAEGEKIKIETVYGAIKPFRDLGKLLRSLEAMEKSPLAASVTVQAVPGLQEMLRGVFGRPAEAVSSQEFRELKKMVERFIKKKK